MPGMQPSDVAELVEVLDPRLSPDATTIAFVVQNPDVGDNVYRSGVWTVPVDGSSEAVRVSPGLARDQKPRWSPDGARLAYVTLHPDKRRDVVVMDVDGGHCLTAMCWPDEIDDLAWSPDGSRLALSARVRDEARYAHTNPKDQPARVIDRLASRLDTVGWTHDRPRHVVVVDVAADATPTIVSDGPFHDTGVSWSPDGSLIAFSSGRHDTWDRDMATDLFVVSPDGGEPRQVTQGTGYTHAGPSFSEDGSLLAFVRGDRRSFPRHGQVGVVAVDGGPDELRTTALDRNCAPYLLPAREPVWDGGDLWFQVEDAGNLHLYRVAGDGTGKPELMVGGDRFVTSFDVRGGVMAFTATTPTSLPELFVATSDGEERQLTAFGAPFAEGRELVAPERFVATSPDGTEVEAWLIRPAGFEAGTQYPTLLNIHGGPYSQYGNKLFDEFQIEAGAGYAVIYSNPRGSSGYAETYARAIRGPKAAEDPGSGWGGVDFDDVMAVMDAALEQFDFIDRDRLGVLGGSYGGFLTSWTIGHTDRFKSALSERAVNNNLSFSWTSDIGHHFPAGYMGVSHLDDPEEYIRQSPITYVRDMRTPVMVMHSEDDLRCPISQAEELFVALKLLDRQVEFVRFPGESHELSRLGSPKHRIERFERILDWFARTL